MEWLLNTTHAYETWWGQLDAATQTSINAKLILLARDGPRLGRPVVDSLYGSRHSNMKELRIQHRGQPYRIFFAFDPNREAALLIGGCKAGDKRFYDVMIPRADSLYDVYLRERGLKE